MQQAVHWWLSTYERLVKSQKFFSSYLTQEDLSRFGRDYIDTGRYLERIFPELNVRFISVTDNIDSMKQAYDMLLPIKNIFNEQYARDISNKVQATVKSKQKAGEFIGAFTSYGYKKSPANKNKLVIDEYASEVVKRVFTMYAQGIGKQSIAKILNAEGILCPSEYKKLNGENYKNCNRLEKTSYWTYSTIKVMLQNEIYIGNMVQGKKHQRMRSKQRLVEKENWIRVENTHEPIIDRQLWDKVQKLLTKKHRDIDLETNKNIFAGFIKCGDCGRAMMKNFWRRADGSKSYSFYCGTYKRSGKDYCTPHTLPFQVLNDIVLGDLKQIIRNVENLQELVKSQSFTATKIRKSTDIELIKLKAELERVKKLKKSIYEDYKDELISKEEFLSYREDYQQKETLYSKQIETLEEKKKESVTEDVFETPWLRRLLELKDIEELDRDIIVEMIDQITVYENRKLKISYNFGNELEHLFSSVYCEDLEKKAI
jgi:site-specific DNA recombinase